MMFQDIWATLRTFRLAEDSFPVILENVAVLLRILTINIYNRGGKSIPWTCYIVTVTAGLCYFYIFIISPMWVIFFRPTESMNMLEVSINVSLMCGCVPSFIMLIGMKFNMKTIHENIEKYVALDARIVLGARFEENLRKYLRVVKKRAIIVWSVLVVNGVIYAMISLMRSDRHITEESHIVYGLEPMHESPNREIIRILSIIAVGSAVNVAVNMAAYIIIFVGYNEAQLFTLSEELNNLRADSRNNCNNVKNRINEDTKDKIINEYIRDRLKILVQYHVTNIHLFKEFNSLWSNAMAMKFIIMSVSIISELLGGLENTYSQLPFSIVLIAIDCLSGQRMIDACNEFEKAVCNCEWEYYDVSNQKTVLLMLINSQKTFMLSAGGMASLNFSCLMTVLRSSYSAYTTLKSRLQN